MRVTVNGDAREIADGSTVLELLRDLKLYPERVAVERNRRVVRRTAYAETPLASDDVLEVLTFVGGG